MITTNLSYKIEKSKDDLPILRVKKDNKWIYIGSKYNMNSEIDKFIYDFSGVKHDEAVLLVYGFGTGEHIKSLRNKFKNNKIIVFEPNVDLLEYINNNDVIAIKQDNNLIVLSCEINELAERIRAEITDTNLNLSEIKSFSNYEKIYMKEYNQFLFEIKQCFLNTLIDKNTRMGYSRRWFETLINNIPYMVNGIPAELYKGTYEDKAAIIVSAGPSLEKNIDCLKLVNNDMLVLSGGRTLRSLIDKDINVDLVGVVDPNEVSFDLCHDYMENLNRPLLFYEGSNDNVVKLHKGKKLFFSYNEFIKKIVERDLELIETGGSIAHVLTSYAVMLGCNPIIFIGQDLAYTNDRSHATISQNRDGKVGFNELKREDDIYVEDINGKCIRTSLVLNDYRRYLERIINNHQDITFINATEGGAKIKGTLQMKLKEAMEKYKGEKFNSFEDIQYNVDMKGNAVRLLNEAKESSFKIISAYKKGLRYLDQLKVLYKTKNSSKINSLLKNLEKIDEEATEQFSKVTLIDSLLYPLICETLTKDKNEERDDYKNIINNIKFYSSIINELDFALEYIDKTIDRLSE